MIGERTEAILEMMRELLAPEGRWTQKAFARTVSGHLTDPCGKTAVCWCLSGAMYKVAVEGKFSLSNKDDVRKLLHKITGDASIAWWNDNVAKSSHDVIRLLDSAIRECRREQP